MNDLKDYECTGQISITDFLKDNLSSCKDTKDNSPEPEEELLLFQVIGQKVIRFHVISKNGELYHCKEGDIYVPQTSFGKEFFHFGIAAQKQAEKNNQKH